MVRVFWSYLIFTYSITALAFIRSELKTESFNFMVNGSTTTIASEGDGHLKKPSLSLKGQLNLGLNIFKGFEFYLLADFPLDHLASLTKHSARDSQYLRHASTTHFPVLNPLISVDIWNQFSILIGGRVSAIANGGVNAEVENDRIDANTRIKISPIASPVVGLKYEGKYFLSMMMYKKSLQSRIDVATDSRFGLTNMHLPITANLSYIAFDSPDAYSVSCVSKLFSKQSFSLEISYLKWDSYLKDDFSLKSSQEYFPIDIVSRQQLNLKNSFVYEGAWALKLSDQNAGFYQCGIMFSIEESAIKDRFKEAPFLDSSTTKFGLFIDQKINDNQSLSYQFSYKYITPEILKTARGNHVNVRGDEFGMQIGYHYTI